MFYYGFLIEENKKNAVYLKLYLNKDDSFLSVKGKMIGNSGSSCIKTFKYFENFADNEKTNNKLLGYLRFIEYEDDLNLLCSYLNPQVESVKACSHAKRKLRLPYISVANEKKMLAKLKLIAEKCLKKYPQTYEEDELSLKNEKDMSFNKRNCIVLRFGEKKVINILIE